MPASAQQAMYDACTGLTFHQPLEDAITLTLKNTDSMIYDTENTLYNFPSHPILAVIQKHPSNKP